MSLDLGHFKKIKEDLHSATLKHPKGHEITVQKSALSDKLKSQLATLPHFDDGGDVPEEPVMDVAAPEAETPALEDTRSLASVPDVAPISPPTAPIGMQSPEGVQVQAPATPEPQSQAVPQKYNIPQAAPQPQAPPLGGVAAQTVNDLNKGFGLEQRGIQKTQQAQSQEGKAEADALDHQARQAQNLFDTYQKQVAANNAEIDSAINDVKNGHIKPDAYLEDKSTLGKVSTAIGLILGGIGGGLLRQENPAMKFLNDNIQRNVQAQVADLGRKNTVLNAYFQKTGNLNQAIGMTNAFLTTLTANAIQKAGAEAKDPLAQANALKAAGELLNNKTMIIRQISGPAAAMQALQQGNSAALEYLPPDTRERAVTLPNGRIALAPTKEDAETSRKALTSLGALQKQIKEYRDFQSNVGRTVPYSDSDYSGDSLKNSLTLELNKLHDLNRLNDNEYNAFKSMVSSPGSLNQGKASAQIDRVEKMINDKMNSELENHLQGYKAPAALPVANKNAKRKS